MHKFLIVNPFGVGDVLFTTPVIRAIKDACQNSFIGYWCNQRTRALLENNPDIDTIFALSRGDIKKIFARSKIKGITSSIALLLQIKRHNFDISIDFSLDHRYNFISKIAGIKKRIGFNYKNRGHFLTQKIDLEGYSSKHVVEHYLGLVRLLGIEAGDKNLRLYVSPEAKEKAKSLLTAYGISEKDLLIGIAPGGGLSWGKDAGRKHWPVENFVRLADSLARDFKAKILIFGDESEREISEAMSKKMTQGLVDFTGKTSLGELIALIDRVKVLVANDGGSLHIASTLGKKTVSFFGPVDPTVYGPYPQNENQHIVLRKNLECSPCYTNFSLSSCLKDKECLNKIEVQEALIAVSKLMS